MNVAAGNGDTLPTEVRAAVDPTRLQLLRIANRIPDRIACSPAAKATRPLGPIMKHPSFDVPMAEELLARWPEWAIPGIDGLPPDSVTPLETNPEFVAALLVGLNQEFNRELLWREFPTDQRGTAFAQFWPTEGADVGRDRPLAGGLLAGQPCCAAAQGDIAMLVRGELLHRFPGTALLAVRGVGGELPAGLQRPTGHPAGAGRVHGALPLPGADRRAGRRRGLVLRVPRADARHPVRLRLRRTSPRTMATWADLTWDGVTTTPAGFVQVGVAPTSRRRRRPTTRPYGAATPPTRRASPSSSRSSWPSARPRCSGLRGAHADDRAVRASARSNRLRTESIDAQALADEQEAVVRRLQAAVAAGDPRATQDKLDAAATEFADLKSRADQASGLFDSARRSAGPDAGRGAHRCSPTATATRSPCCRCGWRRSGGSPACSGSGSTPTTS